MTTCQVFSDSGDLFARVAANLLTIRRRISSTGRDAGSVRIVAVTKTFSAKYVLAAAAAGLTVMGENYVDELRDKRREISDPALTWHFLGALQSNKIPRVAATADVLCSVARLKEIDSIARARAGAVLYVQVDYTGSNGRGGAAPDEVAALVARARLLELDVRGIMTVAPVDAAGSRAAFRATNALADDLGLEERSMGMSDDLEVACELGSSEVRLGRALFGPRASGIAP